MVRCGGRGEGLEGSMVASGARRAGPVGSVDWGLGTRWQISKSQCCRVSLGRAVSVAGVARAQLSPAASPPPSPPAQQGLRSHVAGTGVPLTPAPNRPRPCWARAWRWGNCAPHARPVLWPAGWSVLLLSAWPSRLPPRPLADLSWSPHVSPALPGPPGLDPPLQRQTWQGLVSAGAGSMT